MSSMEELACAYSALILADDDIPITAEKLNTILKAANLSIESIWPTLFARALGDMDVKEFLTNIGGPLATGAGVGAPITAPPTTNGPAGVTKVVEVTAEATKEESSEEDEDMGFGLFD